VDLAALTQRLSPKNQATLPKRSSALVDVGQGDEICVSFAQSIAAADGATYPIMLLMTEIERARREAAILAVESLEPAVRARHVLQFNGGIRRVAVDAQRRVVLPGPYVEALALGREISVINQSASVQVWNPADWAAWQAASEPTPAELINILSL
jgi:DNA-binding transcriptional regulator/RsmH inhibitor MraZ